jgi:hypothetical protein
MEPPPATLPFRENQAVPDGYHVTTRANRGLVIAGASLWGGAYTLSVVGALSVLSSGGLYASNTGQFGPLFIPVLGPFIALGTAPDASLGDDDSRAVGALMILDGLSQVAGATMFIGGLLAEKKILLRNDLASSKAIPEIFIGPRSAALRFHF